MWRILIISVLIAVIKESQQLGGYDYGYDGYTIPIASAPYMCAVRKAGALKCTGTILNEKSVLTSSWCGSEDGLDVVYGIDDISTAGANNIVAGNSNTYTK